MTKQAEHCPIRPVAHEPGPARVEQSKIQYNLILKYNIIWIIHNTGGSLYGLSRIFCTAATSMRWTTAAADIVIVIGVTGERGAALGTCD